MTLAQSAAMAAESFLAIMPIGKFHGTISPTTPAGRYCTVHSQPRGRSASLRGLSRSRCSAQ